MVVAVLPADAAVVAVLPAVAAAVVAVLFAAAAVVVTVLPAAAAVVVLAELAAAVLAAELGAPVFPEHAANRDKANAKASTGALFHLFIKLRPPRFYIIYTRLVAWYKLFCYPLTAPIIMPDTKYF